MKKSIIGFLTLVVAASGCIDASTERSPSEELQELNDIVLNKSEVPEHFRQTHQTRASSNDFTNSKIEWRVDRRFASSDNQKMILSSATLYENNESAREIRDNFVERTPGESYRANISGVNTTFIASNGDSETKAIYLYRRDGRKIYFVSVKGQEYPRELSRDLYRKMVGDTIN